MRCRKERELPSIFIYFPNFCGIFCANISRNASAYVVIGLFAAIGLCFTAIQVYFLDSDNGNSDKALEELKAILKKYRERKRHNTS